MKRITVTLCSALALVAGCAVDDSEAPEEEEVLGTAVSALQSSNALNPNALNPNALNPNALNPNALNPNALTPAALAAIRDPGAAGAMSRQLLSYVVGCAFSPVQSFRFTWRDSSNVEHLEKYTGSLGLASSWAVSPLDTTGQRWVSACLASRVNWYERTVWLSSRGSHANLRTQTAQERADYPSEEGAFYGNLFLPIPVVYACYNEPNEAHSRSLSRDCAVGHLDSSGGVVQCGPVQILGSCADYCQPLDTAGLYHPSCALVLGGAPTVNVITTYLK